MENKELLSVAIHAAIKAGDEILSVYSQTSDIQIEQKDDQSPLTIADKKAHQEIVRLLYNTGIPILSEEGKDVLYEERVKWNRFWMVDPLDGTKEFIKRNGEFTVNISLISNGKPEMGVIWVPVKKWLYYGDETLGAFLCKGDITSYNNLEKLIKASEKLPIKQYKNNYTIVASRSHMSIETEEFIQNLESKHGKAEIISMGSSLKICLVAEGKADIYPRFAPTMEWDTAAGHAIANAAGKTVVDYRTKLPMKYNKQNLLNNWFIVE